MFGKRQDRMLLFLANTLTVIGVPVILLVDGIWRGLKWVIWR